MLRNLLALVLCGLSLGWLMGMSVSPVVKDVLTALLAIITTLLMALAGLSGNEQAENDNSFIGRLKSFDALPVGVFLVFLALGSAFGVLTRTNAVLGPGHRWLSERWELDSAQQKRFRYQLLAATYNLPDSTGKPAASLPNGGGGMLFLEISREFCLETLPMKGEGLQEALRLHIDLLREENPSKAVDKHLNDWRKQLDKPLPETDLQHIRTALCGTH